MVCNVLDDVCMARTVRPASAAWQRRRHYSCSFLRRQHGVARRPARRDMAEGEQRIISEDFEFTMNGENAFFSLSPAPANARVLPHERDAKAPTLQPASPVSA